MGNVINFSDAVKKVNEKRFDKIEDETVQEIVESCIYIVHNTLATLEEEGFDVYDTNNAHDIALLIEAVKGLVYNTLGVKFPTQVLSRILFNIDDREQFIKSLKNTS